MRLKKLTGRVWKIATDPRMVVFLNVVGFGLQIIHTIEQYRQGRSNYQDNKIGFKTEEDDER